MSNSQMHKAGEIYGEGAEKVSQWAQSTADSVQGHSRSDTAQSAHEGKDQAAGFLQQTGEQVKSMAQGATDTVKSTLGMGDNTTTKR